MSFKPNTDDVRESPSLDIIPRLIEAGARVSAYDPEAMEEAAKILSGVHWHDDAYTAAEGSDCVVILTEWNEFRALNLAKLAAVMSQPLLVDLRNIYTSEEIAQTPFTYHSIGCDVIRAHTPNLTVIK